MWLVIACFNISVAETENRCGETRFALQILGSGGPEINDQRASTSYLIWINGRARLMIDAGSGSSYQFEQSRAEFNDLDAILFTHLHTDHVSELESYIKGGYFLRRTHDLTLFGPLGNSLVPSLQQFIQNQFASPTASYRYLAEYFDNSPNSDYKANVVTVPERERDLWRHVYKGDRYILHATYVDHGPIPALAWKISYFGKSIAFTGDTAGNSELLPALLQNSSIIVAHHAIPEQSNPVARRLHMPPSVIGQLAANANTGSLILSHRMLRTIGKEKESLSLIRKHYRGPVEFAEDLRCYVIDPEPVT